jgi:hypothetical protein
MKFFDKIYFLCLSEMGMFVHLYAQIAWTECEDRALLEEVMKQPQNKKDWQKVLSIRKYLFQSLGCCLSTVQ